MTTAIFLLFSFAFLGFGADIVVLWVCLWCSFLYFYVRFHNKYILFYYVVGIIIRPHHLHAFYRCDPLLQMSHTAWVCLSVCLSICVSVSWTHGWATQKPAELIEMPFGVRNGTVTMVSLGGHIVLDFYKPLESTSLTASEPHCKLQ